MERQFRLARWLILIPTLMYGTIPVLVDLMETHVHNSGWPPHARLHAVWLIVLTTCLGIVAAHLVWTASREKPEGIGTSAVIGLCVTGSFWVAGLTRVHYGGGFGGADGVTAVFGFNTNLVVFAIEFVSLATGFFVFRQVESSARALSDRC